MFDQYLKRWGLSRDGEAFASLNGNLLPVRQGDVAAMLKISQSPEELAGNQLMAWWQGDGAAPVLALDGGALLMERAQGSASLAQWVEDGRDDEATRTLCAVAARLHRPRARPLPALVPLEHWFEALCAARSAYRRSRRNRSATAAAMGACLGRALGSLDARSG